MRDGEGIVHLALELTAVHDFAPADLCERVKKVHVLEAARIDCDDAKLLHAVDAGRILSSPERSFMFMSDLSILKSTRS